MASQPIFALNQDWAGPGKGEEEQNDHVFSNVPVCLLRHLIMLVILQERESFALRILCFRF